MLNRRYLRIKALQALYGYFQTGYDDVAKCEKEMFKSIEKIYDLYLIVLLFIEEIGVSSLKTIEQAKQKKLPTQEDLSPNTRFINNHIFSVFSSNRFYKKAINELKFNWNSEQELIKKIVKEFRESDEYNLYMNSTENGFEQDKNIILFLFNNFVSEHDVLYDFFEEKSIYWADDIQLVNIAVNKTIQQINSNTNENTNILLPLYKDENDDKEFIKVILRKTITYSNEYEKKIADKAKNWELERIAMLDILLMKMALAELEHLHNIPVKVTLNEYIEISKFYSTPKSKQFINGILDKLVEELKREGKLQKAGRGLLE
jgi:transcription antitermination protein NusB